jgi:YaiO family outer membrane protein
MKKILLVLVLSFFTQILFAQQDFDPDQLFLEARKLILEGKRDEGRKVAHRILDKYPEYADVLILVGRSHSWDGDYELASEYFERAIKANPEYEDAYIGYLDNRLWASDYEGALGIYNQAQENLRVLSPQLRYKRSRIAFFQKDYKTALEIAEDLFEKEAKITGLLFYIQNLRRLSRINAVGTTYDYDHFHSAIAPWQTFSVYGRTRTKLTGVLMARITHSYRFGGYGTQYELDAYPSLGDNSYAYLNVGYSEAFFLPNYRLGGSVFWNLRNAFELDLGYRHLAFLEPTHIYTASVGKYSGNWWLNLRGNYIPLRGGAISGMAQARFYFKGAEDFLSFQISNGVSPDEQDRDFQSQLMNIYRARFGYQQLLTDRWMIFCFTGYSYEEVGVGRSRNNLNISIGSEFRF